MPFTKLGIIRPPIEGLDEDLQAYIRLIETMAKTPNVQESKNSLDPRTWPMSTHLSLIGMIVMAFMWAFNSGGNWRDLEHRVSAIELKEQQDSSVYARRDLLEQQMSYVVTGLNELKVKVDQLTANSR